MKNFVKFFSALGSFMLGARIFDVLHEQDIEQPWAFIIGFFSIFLMLISIHLLYVTGRDEWKSMIAKTDQELKDEEDERRRVRIEARIEELKHHAYTLAVWDDAEYVENYGRANHQDLLQQRDHIHNEARAMREVSDLMRQQHPVEWHRLNGKLRALHIAEMFAVTPNGAGKAERLKQITEEEKETYEQCKDDPKLCELATQYFKRQRQALFQSRNYGSYEQPDLGLK